MIEWLPLAAAMLATGAVGGVLAGLLGIGGGIVIVPVLEAALGILGVDPAVRMHVAVATSLATIIPTSISSARAHHRRGAVDVPLVRRWAALVLAGSLVGVWIASSVHSVVLSLVFATVALLIALKLLLVRGERSLTAEVPRAPLMALVPTAIGTLSSMMGIGGGTLSVGVLTFCGQPIHRAVGTASLFGLAISLPGTLAFVVTGLDDPRMPSGNLGFVNIVGVALIAPATVLFAPLGASLAHRLSQRQLGTLFGVFLLAMAARMFWRSVS